MENEVSEQGKARIYEHGGSTYTIHVTPVTELTLTAQILVLDTSSKEHHAVRFNPDGTLINKECRISGGASASNDPVQCAENHMHFLNVAIENWAKLQVRFPQLVGVDAPEYNNIVAGDHLHITPTQLDPDVVELMAEHSMQGRDA